jgi:hypothetical protein
LNVSRAASSFFLMASCRSARFRRIGFPYAQARLQQPGCKNPLNPMCRPRRLFQPHHLHSNLLARSRGGKRKPAPRYSPAFPTMKRTSWPQASRRLSRRRLLYCTDGRTV